MTSSRRDFLAASAGLATAAACTTNPRAANATRHIVLLGDSIFDNGVYVPGRPSVIEQLQAALGEGGKATLLAVDGHVTTSIAGQLVGIPADASHLVVSVGGNDALQHLGILDRPIVNSAELLGELAQIHAQFRQRYAAMLDQVLACARPTLVCTIYDSNFDAPRKPLADVALSVFNDCILRCASEVGVPVLDLRRIFRERRDYANPIEPSEIGGAKMVEAILRVTAAHDHASRRTVLYA